MEKFKKLAVRFVKEESGMESVEVALSIALIAAIAGFGMVFLGDALATWFQNAGETFDSGAQMPAQSCSTYLGGTSCTP
jgi:Flp pilus assembly pilin Flp